ncbi:Eco57I restriction-modification methylase domain-containing protein [Arthrobacter dokdonensis]|uniref:Eco57I restriction-modification methylase domain-containing protein n=1 Tax=Arthrobacter dokdonellae TaxID=2211210 RepID=UPI000DE57C1B|nr:DNA methyltransferase [Arthrobacter dokdonellae]
MSTAFQAITVVGGVVPPSLLGRIQSGDVNDPKSLAPAGYHLIGTETIRDAASRTWMYLQDAWTAWRESDAAKRPDGTGAGTGDARQKWLLVLLRELGYGHVQATPGGLTIDGDSYPISHRWESVPIHLLGPGLDLDKRTPKEAGAARRAPQAMVQEFLNRDDSYLWAILSNGLKLRLLRDSTALAGSAYIEFDLESIFDSDLYSEFQMLWQLCHESRLAKRGGADAPADDCWLETWRSESVQAGARALDKLGAGVEKALNSLGTGFLRHPDNRWLLEALHSGELSHRDFHKALLRTAYRLLFLFVVEDRGALFAPEASKQARQRYDDYFSTQRLRKLARTRDGGPHPDLWRTQKMVLSALGGDGLAAVALPALGGLFDPDPRAKRLHPQPHDDLLLGAELSNQDFLKTIRNMGWVSGKTGRIQPVDYRHLGAEELGSVYESLLELVPRVDTETRSFELVHVSGNERKTTGSYYTPPNLVSALLDTALDPLLDDAVNGGSNAEDKERRLLSLTVCDPASGSGGFLVAAARRIARRVAEVRAGDNEPTPGGVQTALHDVVERCIYGVDMNDLAAELAKVSLWLEAMKPGKPLGFLDARIKIGNSLLGTTPALLADGVPDGAFTVLEGDDKKHAAHAKKRNKVENTRKVNEVFESLGQDAFSFGGGTSDMTELINQRLELIKPVGDAQEARSRVLAYAGFDRSEAMEQKRLHADAWCAAFVWPLKNGEPEPPTSSIVRQLGEAGSEAGYPGTVALVRKLARDYRFFHWHLEFPEVFGDPDSGKDTGTEGWPGGFSCLLGNPPWERVKLQEQEFFAAKNQEIAKAPNAAARTRLIKRLAEDDPILHDEFLAAKRKAEGQSASLRTAGRYPLCGHKDVNTYAVFAELFSSLVAPLGRVGFIVKTGLVTDDSYRRFPAMLTETGRLHSFYDFENRANGKKANGKPELYFKDVDSREKFCLVTLGGSKVVFEVSRLSFFVKELANRDADSFELTPSEILAINPNTRNLPTFRTRKDAELNLKLYSRASAFISENSKSTDPDVPVLTRMLDMSLDSEYFVSDSEMRFTSAGWRPIGHEGTKGDGVVYLPVVESKMVHQYDHRWATYQGRDFRDCTIGERLDPEYSVRPRYWIPSSLYEKKSGLAYKSNDWILGWRKLTRSVDERTTIGIVCPIGGLSDSANIIVTDSVRALNIIPVLQSFVFDYSARQKVGGTNFNIFHFKQLPLLDLSKKNLPTEFLNSGHVHWFRVRILELIYTAHDMVGFAQDCGDFGQPFIWDESRRAILRMEIDAALFHLYGLSRNEVEFVMDSFVLMDQHDCVLFGEYRTKRLILEAYDVMQHAIDTGIPFESTLNPPPGQGPRHPSKETVS